MGLPLGLRPVRHALKHLPKEAFRNHPDQVHKTAQRALFNVEEDQLYSELSSGDLISKGMSSHPTEETNFGSFYQGPHSMGQDSYLMMIGGY